MASEDVVEVAEESKPVPPKICEQLTVACTQMREEIISGIEGQKNITERQAGRAAFRAESLYQKAIGFQRYIEKMMQDKGDIILAYADVVEDAKVERIKIEDIPMKTLSVFTKDISIPLKIETMSQMLSIPVGKFRVDIGLDTRKGLLHTQVKNLTAQSRSSYHQHPHVSSEYNVCWGDGSDRAYRFSAQCNYQGLLDMVLYTLTHYSPKNPHIQLLRGWSFNMPLNERICWVCQLPVVKENVYKLPTICQCVRCAHCKQLREDKHDEGCEMLRPRSAPVPPGSTAPSGDVSAWIETARARFSSVLAGEGQSVQGVPLTSVDVGSLVSGGDYITMPDIPEIPSPIPSIEQQFLNTGLRGNMFSAVDSRVMMNTTAYASPCTALNNFTMGQGIEVLRTDEHLPARFTYDNITYTFTDHSNPEFVLMEYPGLDMEGNVIQNWVCILKVDLIRWQQQRDAAIERGV